MITHLQKQNLELKEQNNYLKKRLAAIERFKQKGSKNFKIPAVAIFLVLFTVNIFAQDIPKKANTIVVTDTLLKDPFYNKVTGILFENGYGIQSSDRETGAITTTETAYEYGSVKLTLLVRDKQVLIRGNFKVPVTIDFGMASSGASWYPIVYAGQKNSPARSAWNAMDKIAVSLGDSRQYLIK